MNNIEEFKDANTWYNYLKKMNMRQRKKGEGSEGECFAPYSNNCCYKIIDQESPSFGLYDYEQIITEQQITLDSFAFPKILYILQGNLIAYKTKLIMQDDFKQLDGYQIQEIKNINFDKLLDAYYIMQKDVKTLSTEGISIYDLSCNLLFDGKRLYGVDTCGYYKSNKEDIFKKNIKSYDDAIKDVFSICTTYDLEHHKELENAYSKSVETYLSLVEQIYKKENNTQKTYIYKK